MKGVLPQYYWRCDPPPCKECENRESGCHANCDLYKKWKILHAETIENNREKAKNNSILNYQCRKREIAEKRWKMSRKYSGGGRFD